MTFVIDTNLLIYTQGPVSKGDIAKESIFTRGVVGVQVLNEFAAVLRRKFALKWNVSAGAIADV